jgi:hypothetical protein
MINTQMKIMSPIPSKGEPDSGNGQEINDGAGRVSAFQKEMTALAHPKQEARANPILPEGKPFLKEQEGSDPLNESGGAASSEQGKPPESALAPFFAAVLAGALNMAQKEGSEFEDSASAGLSEGQEAGAPGQEIKGEAMPAQERLSGSGMMLFSLVLPAGSQMNSLEYIESEFTEGAAVAVSSVPFSAAASPIMDQGLKEGNTILAESNGSPTQVSPNGEGEVPAGEQTSSPPEKNIQVNEAVASRGKTIKAPTVDPAAGEKNPTPFEDLFSKFQALDSPGLSKPMSQEGGIRNEKGKEPVHKDSSAPSALNPGLPIGEGPEKNPADPKEFTILKGAPASNDQGGEARFSNTHDFNSNSERKNRDDSLLKFGEFKFSNQGQPFKIGDSFEDGNVSGKAGFTKNHGPDFPSGPSETGMTLPPTFTIKNHGSSSMALMLEPEGLGKLDIELKVTHDQIQGHIMVHEARGKELIENSLPHLLSDMANEGLQIGQFTVSLKNQGREQNQPGAFNHSENRTEPVKPEGAGAISPAPSENNLIHIII